MAFRGILGTCLKSQNNERVASSRGGSIPDQALLASVKLCQVFSCESKSQTLTNEVWNSLHLLQDLTKILTWYG